MSSARMLAARWYVVLLLLLVHHCECQQEVHPSPAHVDNPLIPAAMQLITEYAIWRKLDHILIFDSYLRPGVMPYNVIQLMDCLGQSGVYASIYSTRTHITKDMFHISRHRLGIVTLLAANQHIDQDHILLQASNHRLFGEQQAWLLITSDRVINETLQSLSLGLTSDLVVATATEHHDELTLDSTSKCPVSVVSRTTVTDDSLIPGVYNADSAAGYLAWKAGAGIGQMLLDTAVSHYDLVQVYKIRRDDDRSFVFTALGSWGMTTHFRNVRTFIPVEGRQNLMGFPLVIGYKNWSAVIESVSYPESNKLVYDTDVDDTENLEEIMNFIATSLNATVKYKAYPTVGTEVQDGVWSDLLKAVVSEEVDFGLEKVTVTYHKLDYMAFTHVIMKSSFNIYMHPSELSVSKDIYLTPFSQKLLLCVLGMAILLAVIMLTVSLVANYKARQRNEQQSEDVNVSYAALWVVGILTMQGSIWTPITSSGNMTLISSLMFALIIYNSYAAFITSILSVKTSDINTLDDLFTYGYGVGYIQNSPDEIYLQKQTSALKNIYLRGYNSRVDNIETGLLMAANSKYALFLSTQAARRAIQQLHPYDCRCQIQEFALQSTEEDVAFPLSKSSPYHKVINMEVLRMKESGILSKIHSLMLPKMPRCSTEQSFVSAQFEDIFSAVGLLLAGIILAVIISIGECIIKYRKELGVCVRQKAYRFGGTIKESIRNFEF